MAGFGSGLVQGFQVGDAARARRVQEGRQAESDQWAREDRARLTRDRSIEDQIRAAGAEALGMGATEQPMPVAPDASGVSIEPVPAPRAGAGPAERSAAPHIVGSPEERMVAPEGPALGPPERMKAGALGLESNVGPGQTERAGPAGAPGAPAIGMPKAQRPDDYAAMNRTLKAMSDKAAELGRADLALDYHVKGMKLRDQLRQKASDTARSQYEATGDVGVFVPFINEFMPGDVRLSGIAKEGEGYVLTGEKGGQPFRTQMKAGDLKDFIGQVTDPNVQRALEAKRAEQFNQLRLEQVKKGPTVIPPGSTARYPNGQTFTAPEKPEYKTVKNADGSESLVRIDGSGVGSVFDGVDDDQGIPKPVREMQKGVAAHIFRLNSVNDLNSLAADQRNEVLWQQDLASNLIAANYRTDKWPGLSEARAARIAYEIAAGNAQVGTVDPGDGGAPVRAVLFEGRRYLLDPLSTRRFLGRERAPRGSPGAVAPTDSLGGAQRGNFNDAAEKVGLNAQAIELARSIFEQESRSGAADTGQPNYAGARGPMQVTKSTFNGLQRDGLIPKDFRWDNPEHSMIAGLKLIKRLHQQYAGDRRYGGRGVGRLRGSKGARCWKRTRWGWCAPGHGCLGSCQSARSCWTTIYGCIT